MRAIATMNRKIEWNMVLLGVVLLAVLNGSVQAEQKCDPGKPETTPTSRFKINTQEGTAYDIKTKLTWKLCAEGMTYSGGRCSYERSAHMTYRWDEAMKTFGSEGIGWRMPNIRELMSIVEERCGDPSINTAVFPNTPSAKFWSSSTCTVNNFGDKFQCYVGFFNALYHHDNGEEKEFVRLVRSIDPSQHKNYQNVLNGSSPRAMYILAGEMADRGDSESARNLYRRITKDFPNDELAIKASDNLRNMRR